MFIVIEINGLKTLGDAECVQNQTHLGTNLNSSVTRRSPCGRGGHVLKAKTPHIYRYTCGDQYDNNMKHEKDLK